KKAKSDEWIKKASDTITEDRIGENPLLADLRIRKNEIQRELDADKALGRTDEHPLVKQKRKRMSELDAQMEKTDPQAKLDGTVKPNEQKIAEQRANETLQGTLVALNRQKDELAAQIEQYEVLNRNFIVIRNDFSKLQRDLTEAQGQLGFWEDNLRRIIVALK